MGESYFQVYMFFVRVSGIPINRKRVSRLKPLCNGRSIAFFYFTYFSVLIDFVFKKNEIEESIENVRFVFGMVVLTCLHLYLRQPKTSKCRIDTGIFLGFATEIQIKG